MEIDKIRQIAALRWRLQSNPKDNAFSAVYNFLNLSGHLIPKATVGSKIPIDKDKGTSMLEVEMALKDLGIKALSVKIPVEKLAEVPLPALALVEKKDATEFVVLYRVEATEICFLNPRLGWTFEPIESFCNKWDGHVIIATSGNLPKNCIPDIDLGMESEVVTILEDFLSDDDCDYLLKISQGLFQKSRVVGKENEALLDEKSRKSQSAYLMDKDNPALNELYSKISLKLGFDANRFESFQCVSYNPGDFFDYHFDTVELAPEDQYTNPRSHTLLVYLNDDFLGGETAFPMLNTKITPKKRRAVLFSNLEPDGRHLRVESIHAGLPVIDGKKYALNLWVHLRSLK